LRPERVDSEDQLRESRRSLNRKADNIVDSLQDDGRNPLLVQRLKTIQEELAEIDEALKMAAEVVTPPLSEEQTRELVSRKLAELDAALTGPPEAVKHKLSKHIDGLLMKLVETPDGPRYEVTGEIRLFADGEARVPRVDQSPWVHRRERDRCASELSNTPRALGRPGAGGSRTCRMRNAGGAGRPWRFGCG